MTALWREPNNGNVNFNDVNPRGEDARGVAFFTRVVPLVTLLSNINKNQTEIVFLEDKRLRYHFVNTALSPHIANKYFTLKKFHITLTTGTF